MNMVERVARGLCKHDCLCEEAAGWQRSCLPGECTKHEFYKDEARAAIEAMKDPTDAMVIAFTGKMPSDPDAPMQAVACWQAMISAALEEAE